MELPQQVSYEKPTFLNDVTVLKWSEHYKLLEGIDNGSARRMKAKKFLMEKCFKWSKKHKNWVCKPLKNYNKTYYHIRWDSHKENYKTGEPGDFICSCQFNVKTGMICSHILGLYLYLKKRNWNRRFERGQEILPISEEEKIEDTEEEKENEKD